MNVQASEAKKNAIQQTIHRLFESYSALAEEVEDNDEGWEFSDQVYNHFNFGFERDEELGDSLRLLLEKMEKVFTSAYSHVNGLAKEVDSAYGQMMKGRGLVGGIADVGSDTPYGGKAIQHKFTAAKGYADVDAHIKKALLQLTGAKGETPRNDDIRIADITIDEATNTWPYTQAQATPGIQAFLTTVCQRVSTQYTNMVAGLTPPVGLQFNQWLTSKPLPASVHDVISVRDWQTHHEDRDDDELRYPNASWAMCKTQTGPFGAASWHRPPQLLVKLRFLHGFQVNVTTTFGHPSVYQRVAQVNVAICAGQHGHTFYKVTKYRYMT